MVKKELKLVKFLFFEVQKGISTSMSSYIIFYFMSRIRKRAFNISINKKLEYLEWDTMI